MATSGLQKLEAVNEMLECKNEARAAALDSSGSWPTLTYGNSSAGLAEYMLDRVSRRMQSYGWPDNTNYGQRYTPSGSPFKVALANTVLWLRGAGRDAYRNLTIRGVSGTSYIWDVDRRTNEYADATVIEVDEIVWLDFDNLQPRTKDVVAAAAAVIFQRRTRGSPEHDAYLGEERLIADLMADRIRLRMTPEPINPSPVLAALLQRGQQTRGENARA